MASYYYFASTLPLLRLDWPQPITLSTFLAHAEKQLTPKDWKILKGAVDGSSSTYPFLTAYQTFVDNLNTALAKKRVGRLGFTEFDDVVKSSSSKEFELLADHLLSYSDPLEAELARITLVWKHIDALIGLKIFEFDALLGYALKLTLLERVTTFTQEIGQATFEALLGALKSEIDQM